MPDTPNKTKMARKKAREAEKKFADKIRTYVSKHKSVAQDVAIFKDMLGYGRFTNTMLASDVRLRRQASKYLGEGLEKFSKENPDLTFHFWTLTHSRGNISDRDPCIDLKFLRSIIDKAFRKLRLDAIYVIEMQGVGNFPRKGEGRTMMVHGHVISWTSQPFDIKLVLEDFHSGDVWHNDLSAKPIVIKKIGSAEGELDYLAYYLLKPPYEVKMLEDRADGGRLKATEAGYRPEFAARILEGQSQLELKELVRSVNGGKLIRQDWSRRLSSWHRSRQGWSRGNIPAYYFTDLWDRYRMKKRKRTYAPYTIIR